MPRNSQRSLAPILQVSAELVVSAHQPSLAKFEPETGCILGAYLDLDPNLTESYRDSNERIHKLPEPWEKVVGRRHGMYFFYLGYGRDVPVDWVQKLASTDRFVHIAVEPNDGLDAITEGATLYALADALASTKAKIFLRFGSEMNGPWVPYHGDPAKYVEKFRLVCDVMRERAPNVAMVWCPYTTPKTHIRDYYPGDEWVDWVGVNMYNVTYFDQNPKLPAKHIKPTDMLDFVYKNYADRKPIMIGEYATTHYSPLENKTYPEWARNNINLLYSALPTKYPRVKAINYFNSNNLLVAHRKNNNYLVEDIPMVLQAYSAQISSQYFIDRASAVPDRPLMAIDARVPESLLIEGPTLVRVNVVNPDAVAKIQFKIDGSPIRTQSAQRSASVEIDPSLYEAGARKLTVEALNADGKRVGFAETTLVMDNRIPAQSAAVAPSR